MTTDQQTPQPVTDGTDHLAEANAYIASTGHFAAGTEESLTALAHAAIAIAQSLQALVAAVERSNTQ